MQWNIHAVLLTIQDKAKLLLSCRCFGSLRPEWTRQRPSLPLLLLSMQLWSREFAQIFYVSLSRSLSEITESTGTHSFPFCFLVISKYLMCYISKINTYVYTHHHMFISKRTMSFCSECAYQGRCKKGLGFCWSSKLNVILCQQIGNPSPAYTLQKRASRCLFF